MRRWNGWGDDTYSLPVQPQALQFLQQRIGKAIPFSDASWEQVCAQVPPARLPAHPLIDTSAATRVRYSRGQSLPDWLALRYGRIAHFPDGVAFPESSADVSTLLAWAKQHGVALIPYGGGTSVAGHINVVDNAQPVLTVVMQRMCQLISLDRQSQLASFGAGVFGPDLEAQLRAHGYTLGHFPQSFEYSTLGGWVVTRSSGQQSLRYGRIEQLFAGGRLETPAGSLQLPTFPASAAGPDLREWVLGSEGRLGILTEATVRISPLPQQEAFHAVFFPDWEQAQAAVQQIAQSKLPLSMLRLSNATETLTSLTLAGHASLIRWLERYLSLRNCKEQKCLLLIGASGSQAQVRFALRAALAIAATHRGVHIGKTMGEKWKQGRFRNVYLRNTLWQHGYAIDTVETACDWPKVRAMMRGVELAAQQSFAEFGEQVHTYTHLSHLYAQGASVYTTFVFRLSGDYETDLARWTSLKAKVSETIVRLGGTISHQHGVGRDHASYLQAEKGELGLSALRAMARHFDPDQRMNPGKLFDTAQDAS